MLNTTVYNKFKSYLGEGGSRAWKTCGMSGGAWCCAEVCTVHRNAKSSLFYGGKTVVYCPTAYQYDKAKLARIPLYLAMSGDTIYFDWDGNGVPNHIGQVADKIDAGTIKTIEGNTGSPARVRHRTRPEKYVLGVFRPHYKPSETPKAQVLKADGDFGFKSIYNLQLALGVKANAILSKATVKALQKKAGVTADGDWGTKTSKAVQKMVGATVDGDFGVNSVKALQNWISTENKNAHRI